MTAGLPDLSPAQVSRREREIRRGMAELQALDAASLGPEELLSYRMLALFLERELFTFEEMRPLENNPMRQSGFLNMGGYVRRDYAPLEDSCGPPQLLFVRFQTSCKRWIQPCVKTFPATWWI